MSFKCRDGTQRWRASEESGLIAVMGAGFVVLDEVGDAAGNDRVAHSEAAVAATDCRCQDKDDIVRTTPSACWFRAASLEAYSVFSCGVV